MRKIHGSLLGQNRFETIATGAEANREVQKLQWHSQRCDKAVLDAHRARTEREGKLDLQLTTWVRGQRESRLAQCLARNPAGSGSRDTAEGGEQIQKATLNCRTYTRCAHLLRARGL